jgi:hypothetical protein
MALGILAFSVLGNGGTVIDILALGYWVILQATLTTTGVA